MDIQKLLEKELNQAIPGLQFYQQRIESAINLAPTGPTRNALCDANIHLTEVLKNLQEARMKV